MGFQQGLSGLNTAAKQLDVIGNNVANAGTVGFKQSQAQFADLYAASLAGGGGGTAVGTGVKLATVAQQFSQGNVTNTNNSMDIAISGAGFFQMIDQGGSILYSRNGQFQVDKDGYMVNSQGHQVQGYQALAGVVTAVQGPLRIDPTPLPPKQTSNLAAGGVPIAVGANVDSRAAFPLGITQGTLTGAALPGLTIASGGVPSVGSVTTGAAVTTFDYTTNSVSFAVDGVTVNLNANYTDAPGVATAIGTQLGAAYNVTEAAGVITIATVATGLPAPVISAYNGNVDGIPTLVPDVITGGVSTATAGSVTTGAAVTVFDYTVDQASFTVDGNPVLLNANYTDAPGVAAAIGVQLGAAYNVTQAAGVITIANAATGTPAPVIAAYNGDVDGNATTVADVISGGTSTATAGSVTTGAAVTAFDYSTNSISFDVDGTPVVLNANYANAAGVAAAIGTALGAAYNVTEAAGVVTIATVATGTPAPVIANYNGDVDGIPTIVPDVITGGTSVAGSSGPNDIFTVTVDGVGPVTVTIPAGTYTTTAALASAVQAAVNADATLVAAGKSVTVTQGASGTLVMASGLGGGGSSIAVADVVAGTVANLFGAATPVAGAGSFNPNAPDSYNNSTSLTVYDSKGTQHVATMYFQKASPNVWNTYLTIDSTVVPATGTAMATLNFDTAGRLVTVTPGASSSQGATNKTVISDPTYTPLGANPLPLAFDFTQTTQYGGAFGVNSLTQDGYTSGELSGFSTGTDGVISGRYTNGQSQALGQIGLVNFANPQGLQPVGNNEWVETPQSGLVPLNRPGSSGLGLLQSSAVEDSNVDLTAELVNMITAQRVYQANAQTIKTQDAVLQTLVNLR